MPDSDSRRLENLFGSLLTALADSLTARAEQVVGHSGATAAALTYLAQVPGLSIDRLKDPLGLSQSATVRLVDRLVADGLAQRRPGRNGRSVSVHLTSPGEKLARCLLDQRHAVLAAALAPLGVAERGTLTSLVEKVLGHVTLRSAHGERICRLCDLTVCPGSTCPVVLAAVQAPGPAAGTRADIGAPGGIRTHMPFGNGF